MTIDIIELHQLVLEGDDTAEKRLFEGLTVRFRLFLRRRVRNADDAEEILQEAMLVISREYRTMTFEKSFAAWVYKVLDNRIMAYAKTKKKTVNKVVQMSELVDHQKARHPNPDLVMQLNRCMKLICKANRRYARILALHFQGFATDEICKRIDIKRNNCWTILSRAREMLQDCLKNGEIAR